MYRQKDLWRRQNWQVAVTGAFITKRNSGEHRLKPLTLKPEHMRGMTRDFVPKVIVNENYILCITGGSIQLLFFDDNDILPKQSGSFFDVGQLKVEPSQICKFGPSNV